MNYHNIYENIIIKARSKERFRCDIYYENHHIVPRCMGGDNKKSNLVLLTAREHFVCHWLLTKIFPDVDSLIFAFWMMCTGVKKERNYRITSKTYEILKSKYSKLMSEKYKGRKLSDETKRKMSESRTGEKHPLYGLRGKNSPLYGKKHSEETKQKLSVSKIGINNPMYGKKFSDEHKRKISLSGLGRTHTEESKQKMKKPKQKIKCPYCHVIGGKPQMIQWHFENCKQKVA